jgi:hypothetical protein
MPVGGLKFGKVAVARAAGSQVIEPLLRLGQRHRMRGDSPEDIRAGASRTVRIWKLVEQAPAQSVQDAPFISLGISLCVQKPLLFQMRVTI